METVIPAYRIFPLGDSAITVDFGNYIDEAINKEVMTRFRQLQEKPLVGMIEAIPAYSSLTVYYDLYSVRKIMPKEKRVYDWMKEELEKRLQQSPEKEEYSVRRITIPVCYEKEFAVDLSALAAAKNISMEEVIHIHTSKTYRVYMLGFLPGFSYMGEVDERISMSRKAQPVPVAAGSVGIAGKQTGIYPLASPGGWQIIGRTPLKLFETEKENPVLLNAGDIVQFVSIGKDEFKSY